MTFRSDWDQSARAVAVAGHDNYACRNSGRLGGSWPLSEQARHFELGQVLNSAITDLIAPARVGALGSHHAGLWECDLADNALIWSGGVYDLFGLERGAAITRPECLAHYSPESCAALERLRAFAIRTKQGFTLDVEISAAAVGESRSVRVIAAPVCEEDRVTRLHGLKLII